MRWYRVFRNDGTGWYCATHGNPAETMADVMADTARHTDQVLERADVKAALMDYSEDGGRYARIIRELAGLVRDWRDAYHTETRRLDQLTAELETARQRAGRYKPWFEGTLGDLHAMLVDGLWRDRTSQPDEPVTLYVLADTDTIIREAAP